MDTAQPVDSSIPCSSTIVDAFQRTIDYLRISVTDKCNLRCLYCMPEEGLPWIPRPDLLTYEEIVQIVRAGARIGLKKLRITGGEPLVRRDVTRLVSMLSRVPGIEDIALSTNGILLAGMAEELKLAGVRRVNVSLDTLNEAKFERIARRPGLSAVLEGIAAAEQVGMKPVKVNMVVMRGINDDEIEAFARLTLASEWHVRYIELMPVEDNVALQEAAYISSEEILARLGALAHLEPVPGPDGNGPARYFRLPGAKGTVGVINPISDAYCAACNRVRLKANGRLRLCLFGDHEVDLRTPLRDGATLEEIGAIFLSAMQMKPESHNLGVAALSTSMRAFSEVGG